MTNKELLNFSFMGASGFQSGTLFQLIKNFSRIKVLIKIVKISIYYFLCGGMSEMPKFLIYVNYDTVVYYYVHNEIEK